MIIMSEFWSYFVRKISTTSYKKRLKEQHLFSRDERREKRDRWRFFGISKLLAVISWAKRHQWRGKSYSQVFSCNIAWSHQTFHTSVSPKSILANVTTPKSILVKVRIASNISDTQSDQIASTRHTQLCSVLELPIPWRWLKPQHWLQPRAAKPNTLIWEEAELLLGSLQSGQTTTEREDRSS